MGVDALRHAAEDDHHLVVEQGIVDDQFQQRARFDAGVGHLDQFHLLVLELAGEHLAGVGIGVDHFHPAADEIAAFVDLDPGVRTPVGMAYRAGDLHNAERKEARRRIDIAGAYQHRSDTMLPRTEAAVIQLVFGQRRFEDFVVDFFGEVFFAFEELFGLAFFTGAGFGGGGV